MATLATILRKFDGAGAEPRRMETAQPNPYQLRALPNEDIFFYIKRVDNSRLVREPDPQAKSECWSTIGAVCAVAAVLITSQTAPIVDQHSDLACGSGSRTRRELSTRLM